MFLPDISACVWQGRPQNTSKRKVHIVKGCVSEVSGKVGAASGSVDSVSDVDDRLV